MVSPWFLLEIPSDAPADLDLSIQPRVRDNSGSYALETASAWCRLHGCCDRTIAGWEGSGLFSGPTRTEPAAPLCSQKLFHSFFKKYIKSGSTLARHLSLLFPHLQARKAAEFASTPLFSWLSSCRKSCILSSPQGISNSFFLNSLEYSCWYGKEE